MLVTVLMTSGEIRYYDDIRQVYTDHRGLVMITDQEKRNIIPTGDYEKIISPKKEEEE